MCNSFGVDTDAGAIAYASIAIPCMPAMQFRHVDLPFLRPADMRFEFIVFAGIRTTSMMRGGRAPRERRPIAQSWCVRARPSRSRRDRGSWLVRLYDRIERGQLVRGVSEVQGLLQRVSTLRCTDIEVRPSRRSGSPSGMRAVRRRAYGRIG